MNLSTTFLCVVTVISRLPTLVMSSSLTAVHKSSFVLQLYKRVRNGNRPHEFDLACSHAHIRRQICEDIASSGHFCREGFIPVDEEELATSYDKLFARIYIARTGQPKNEYVNWCLPQILKVSDFFCDLTSPFREYVFACPFKCVFDGQAYVHYVSKEYNVVEGSSGRRAGRFLFLNRAAEPYYPYASMSLAEESAESYAAFMDFNVEQYYLDRKRKNHHLAGNSDLDPVCKLIVDGPDNQEHRLCAIIFSSSYFRETIENVAAPLLGVLYGCDKNEVAFQTSEGRHGAVVDASYTEWMTRCIVRTRQRRFKNFYVSRAYESNEVFVYQYSDSDRVMYLENVITNVGIVLEPATFDVNTLFLENFWLK